MFYFRCKLDICVEAKIENILNDTSHTITLDKRAQSYTKNDNSVSPSFYAKHMSAFWLWQIYFLVVKCLENLISSVCFLHHGLYFEKACWFVVSKVVLVVSI